MEWLYARYGQAALIKNPLPWLRRESPCLFLVGPQYNREVLMDEENLRPTGIWPVPGPEGSAQNNLRNNYLTSHGEEHAAFSANVSPHVNRTKVNQQFDQVRQIALAETQNWPVGTTADIFSLTRRLTQHYAFSLLFGESDLDRIRELGALVDRYHASNWSLAALLFRFNSFGLPYRRVLENADDLQSFILSWLEERQGCPLDQDLRTAMLNATDLDGDRLCPERSAAHISGLALASYETSATALTWAIFLLSQHPAIAVELLDELQAMPAIEEIDLDKLASLPLLDAVIKETLRLIAPVPFLGFRTVRQCEIAGCPLPERALVIICPHLTHRMPEIYEAPDRFRPSRWLTIRPTAYEYLPFSGGPRRCPGYWFATNNLKTALAVTMLRYRITADPGARIDRSYAATTVPKHGVSMQIAKQDRAYPINAGRGTIFDLFQIERPRAAT